MLVTLLGAGLLALGGMRLLWPPASGVDFVPTGVSVGSCVVGAMCLVARWRPRAVSCAIALLAGLAAYNIARISQGVGAESCGCHGSLWDSSHYATLVLVGVLLAAFSVAQARLVREKQVRASPPLALPLVAAGALYALLVQAPAQEAPEPPLATVEATSHVPTLIRSSDAPHQRAPAVPSQSPPRVVRVLARWERSQDPIEGVSVWWDHPEAESYAATTDATGEATLGVPEGARRIVGRAEGAWATAEDVDGAEALILEFSDEISLAGTTVDLAGRPVPYVALWLRGDGAERSSGAGKFPSWDSRFEERRFSSNDRGYFQVRGLTSKIVSIVPVGPNIRLFVGNVPAYFAHVPSRQNMVTIERCASYEVRLVSSVDGSQVPPPWRVSMEGADALVASVFERLRDRVRLHLPIERFPAGSILKLTVGGKGFAPQVRKVSLPTEGLIEIPIDPVPGSDAFGSIELALPASFNPPGSWTNITLVDQAGLASPILREHEVLVGKWRVARVSPGTYDVSYMGQRIAAGVQVRDAETTRVAADTSGFATLHLLPTREGKPLLGAFNVEVSYSSPKSSMMGSWTVETDGDGHLPLGSFPISGDLRLRQVMRSTDRLAEPLRVLLREDERVGRFVEVKLIGWE